MVRDSQQTTVRFLLRLICWIVACTTWVMARRPSSTFTPHHSHSQYWPFSAQVYTLSWVNPRLPIHPRIVRIGTSATLTSNGTIQTIQVAQSNALIRGYELFFGIWNSQYGGILLANNTLARIQLEVFDDYGDPRRVKWIYNDMIDKGYRLLFAPYDAALSKVAIETAHARGALVLAPTAGDIKTFAQRPLAFSMLPSREHYLWETMRLLAEKGARSVAFLEIGSSDICQSVHTLANRHGIVFKGGVTLSSVPSTSEIANAVSSIKTNHSNLDILVSCTIESSVCLTLIDQLKQSPYDPKALVLIDCFHDSQFSLAISSKRQYVISIDTLTFQAFNGTMISASSAKTLSGVSVAEFKDMFFHAYNSGKNSSRPPNEAYLGFATASALVWALEQAASIHPTQVGTKLSLVNHTTVIGHLSFDQYGVSQLGVNTIQFQHDGNSAVVAPVVRKTTEVVYPRPTWNYLECVNVISQNYQSSAIGFAMSQGVYVCQTCAPGSRGKYNWTINAFVCEECPKGRYSVSQMISSSQGMIARVDCLDCTTGAFTNYSGATQCKLCEAGSIANTSGQTACTLCPAGTSSRRSAATSCTPCGAQFYSAQAGASSCRPCPHGAVCRTNANGLRTNFTNADGYWMIQPGDALSLHSCRHGKGEACMAGARCFVHSKTREPSMTGVMCSECRKGYGRIGPADLCYHCASTPENIFWCFATAAHIGAVACVIGYFTLNQDPTRPKQMIAVILKQIFNHVATLTVILDTVQIEVPIGKSLQESLKVSKTLFGGSSPHRMQLAVDCLTRRFFPSIPTYEVYTWMGILWIPLWEGSLCIMYLFYRLWRRSRGKSKGGRQFVCLLVVNLFVIYPRASEMMLSPFRCFTVDRSRLLYDMSVICGSKNHLLLCMVAIFALVFIAMGIPMLLFLTLRYYFKKEMLRDPKIQTMFGFMYNGFDPGQYHFECIFMVRKLAFQIATLIPGLGLASRDMRESEAILSCTMQLLAVTFLVIHLNWEPFDNRSFFLLDRIESAGLWSVFATVFLQTWMWMTDKSVWMQTIFHRDVRDTLCAIMLCYCHARFWFWAIYGILWNSSTRSWVQTHCRNTCARRWLKRGQVRMEPSKLVLLDCTMKEEDFFREFIIQMIYLIFEDGDPGSSEFDPAILWSAIQQVVVQAQHDRQRREREATVQHQFSLARRLFRETKNKTHSRLCTVASKLRLKSEPQLSEDKQRDWTEARAGSINSEPVFHSQAVIAQTHGMHFSVEELHEAMMGISASLIAGGASTDRFSPRGSVRSPLSSPPSHMNRGISIPVIAIDKLASDGHPDDTPKSGRSEASEEARDAPAATAVPEGPGVDVDALLEAQKVKIHQEYQEQLEHLTSKLMEEVLATHSVRAELEETKAELMRLKESLSRSEAEHEATLNNWDMWFPNRGTKAVTEQHSRFGIGDDTDSTDVACEAPLLPGHFSRNGMHFRPPQPSGSRDRSPFTAKLHPSSLKVEKIMQPEHQVALEIACRNSSRSSEQFRRILMEDDVQSMKQDVLSLQNETEFLHRVIGEQRALLESIGVHAGGPAIQKGRGKIIENRVRQHSPSTLASVCRSAEPVLPSQPLTIGKLDSKFDFMKL